MKTDRELLEAAAKAAGLNVKAERVDADDRFLGLIVGPKHTKLKVDWNPLTDDGDALRLAVALRMCVESWGSGASAVVEVNNLVWIAEPHYGDDPGRATRRAIVRAAAALEAG